MREVDLAPFRTARELRWHPWTEFGSGGGADGDLIADGTKYLPLDIFSPEEVECDQITPPLSGGVGVVVASPETVEDAHEALRGWCREQLGRDDVVFDPWA